MNIDVRPPDSPVEQPAAAKIDIDVVTAAIPAHGPVAATTARGNPAVPVAPRHTAAHPSALVLPHTLPPGRNRAP